MTTVNKFAHVTPGTWINSETLRGFKLVGDTKMKFYWGDHGDTAEQDSTIFDFGTGTLRNNALVALLGSGVVTQTTP